MPYDPGYDDDEPAPRGADADAGRARRFDDFDCPDCAANNPYGDGFGDGDEVRCCYCGQDFRVVVSDAGRLTLKVL